VTRARQEDGDLDQLDFRLRCAPAECTRAALTCGVAEARAGGQDPSGDIGEGPGEVGEGEALELEDALTVELAVGGDEATPDADADASTEPADVGGEALELDDALAAGLAAGDSDEAAPEVEVDASVEPADVGAAAGPGVGADGDSRDEL
jgi:hypothetical protein